MIFLRKFFASWFNVQGVPLPRFQIPDSNKRTSFVRDGIRYYIYHLQAFRKIYHLSDFGIPFPGFNKTKYQNALKQGQFGKDLYLQSIANQQLLNLHIRELKQHCHKSTVNVFSGTVIIGNQSPTDVIFFTDSQTNIMVFHYANTKHYWSGWKLQPKKFQNLGLTKTLILQNNP